LRARCLALLTGCAVLAGCASLPPGALPGRDQVGDFALEARFALRVTLPDSAPQSAGGRLSWEHKNDANRILIANPLGIALAEIETTPALSRLHTADGKRLESPDADALMEEVTGQRLPVTRLPAWLLGRPGPNAAVSIDPLGRPSQLQEGEWRIDYDYADFDAGALPSRLTLNRNQEIELRLRIEEWKEAP